MAYFFHHIRFLSSQIQTYRTKTKNIDFNFLYFLRMTSFIVLSCESLELTAGNGVQEAQHQTLPAGHPSHQQKLTKITIKSKIPPNEQKTLPITIQRQNNQYQMIGLSFLRTSVKMDVSENGTRLLKKKLGYKIKRRFIISFFVS